MGVAEPMWKVGELAAQVGLTVRTLHHYDDIGLVRPSERTSSGHRLYRTADVERLYQVLALRQLGLGLETVIELVAGSAAMPQVLAAHRDFLAAQLDATRELYDRVATLAATAENRTDTSADSFLELIRRVVMVDETVKKYFSDTQLAQLAERREELGDEQIAATEAAWAELIPRVNAAMDAGMEPTDPRAQEMAAQWMGLLEGFHGGDEGLRDSLYRMHTENSQRIVQEFCGPTPEQIAFITAANAARG
ncbi:MerR family transcriptional regulator [Nocardia stercoris]|uniref:MerR family transcriptional regulator n=2 Tax=Nocardia stercoris TaxID=2483361 RepID=A0A3M2KQZ4_9NOCA|nr:MerR family transcriptional regulator [Nocardia stercoris]